MFKADIQHDAFSIKSDQYEKSKIKKGNPKEQDS